MVKIYTGLRPQKLNVLFLVLIEVIKYTRGEGGLNLSGPIISQSVSSNDRNGGHNCDSGAWALREVQNFSNGVHTLRQDEALHGFVQP